jgi:hypothetical protein
METIIIRVIEELTEDEIKEARAKNPGKKIIFLIEKKDNTFSSDSPEGLIILPYAARKVLCGPIYKDYQKGRKPPKNKWIPKSRGGKK